MTSGGKPFNSEREFTIADDKKDWVSLGRLSFHIIDRGGKYFLRLADNESPVRTKFPGVMWNPPNEEFKVEAKLHRGPMTPGEASLHSARSSR